MPEIGQSINWRQHIQRVLPASWRTIREAPVGAAFCSASGLCVMVSAAYETDQKPWLHVSLSRPDSIPTYDDITTVKDVFIGPDRTAYQVFPPRAKHINIHPYCLHLFCCIDGAVTPDFTRGGPTL